MTDNSYALVEALLIEPSAGTMRGMRDSLLQMGIRKSHPRQTIDGVAASAVSLSPDLVIIDIDSPEIDGLKFIRWMRTDTEYPNPFACVVATTWKPTEALIHKVDSSGADALLTKPFSPKQLMDQVHHLVDARKRFVVSTDYIGPDRRKAPRDGHPIPSLDAPNTLRLKTTGHWDGGIAREQIAKGILWVAERKALRDSFQIAFLLEYAKPGLTTRPPERMAFLHALKAGTLIEDLLKRLLQRDHDPHLETTCKALLALIERIRHNPETPAAKPDLDQLHALSFALAQAVDPTRTPESLTAEITEATTDYRARMECLKAVKPSS